MKKYYIRKILNKNEINQIKSIIEDSNKNNFWVDGLTFMHDGDKKVKNNLELSNENYNSIINNMIVESISKDQKFIDFSIPKKTYQNKIYKTPPNGYYRPHIDNWNNGHFSTTVFLNEPSEYDGGELCLYFGGDDEIEIKLKPGWGVTYQTGIIHRVNEVKSGNRYVSVLWTTSIISDSFMRFLYQELSNIQRLVDINSQPIFLKKCSDYEKDLSFCISNIRNEILRNYLD
jgi:PKHD-type hydroxylase